VVNAGILRLGSVETVSLDDLERMLDVNVRGVFVAIQAAAPRLADGGSVITIGSNTAIRTGFPGSSVYSMTKAAVATMVKGIALDPAPRAITVNNVQPGPSETDMTVDHLEMVKSLIPLGRVGQPREIAGLVAYLASEESTYMTGASLTIDGGYVLWASCRAAHASVRAAKCARLFKMERRNGHRLVVRIAGTRTPDCDRPQVAASRWSRRSPPEGTGIDAITWLAVGPDR
jgi:short-subunit dehydrogenase